MTKENDQGLRNIRRALISVSDKTGIVEFARELKGFGVEIISTDGTANSPTDYTAKTGTLIFNPGD